LLYVYYFGFERRGVGVKLKILGFGISVSMGVRTRGKWGQLTNLEKWMKNLKAKTCKKEQFSMFMLYFESNQGRQV